jgi:adenylate kinase
MKCVVLLGPPGAGKGTQGKRLCDKFDWTHFSTGDLIRSEIAKATSFGKSVVSYQAEGKLVPDELLLGEVASFFSVLDIGGIVSDGFPRTEPQAIALDALLLKLDASSKVVHLTTPLSVIMDRALSRRICSNCGEIFNLSINPPKTSGVCDFCSGSLSLRQDDTASVIAVRYGVYEQEINRVLSYYGDRVVTLDGTLSPDLVFSHLEKACGLI